MRKILYTSIYEWAVCARESIKKKLYKPLARMYIIAIKRNYCVYICAGRVRADNTCNEKKILLMFFFFINSHIMQTIHIVCVAAYERKLQFCAVCVCACVGRLQADDKSAAPSLSPANISYIYDMGTANTDDESQRERMSTFAEYFLILYSFFFSNYNAIKKISKIHIFKKFSLMCGIPHWVKFIALVYLL